MISHKSSDFGAECPFYFDALFNPGFTCTRRCCSFGRCVDRLNVQFFFYSFIFLFPSCFCHHTPVHVFCDATCTNGSSYRGRCNEDAHHHLVVAKPPVEIDCGTDAPQLFAAALSAVTVMTMSAPTRNVS